MRINELANQRNEPLDEALSPIRFDFIVFLCVLGEPCGEKDLHQR